MEARDEFEFFFSVFFAVSHVCIFLNEENTLRCCCHNHQHALSGYSRVSTLYVQVHKRVWVFSFKFDSGQLSRYLRVISCVRNFLTELELSRCTEQSGAAICCWKNFTLLFSRWNFFSSSSFHRAHTFFYYFAPVAALIFELEKANFLDYMWHTKLYMLLVGWQRERIKFFSPLKVLLEERTRRARASRESN